MHQLIFSVDAVAHNDSLNVVSKFEKTLKTQKYVWATQQKIADFFQTKWNTFVFLLHRLIIKSLDLLDFINILYILFQIIIIWCKSYFNCGGHFSLWMG